jgi:hypothetical protein
MHIRTSDQPKLEFGIGSYTCNWGAHLCGLYETGTERDEIIDGFLHQGDVDDDALLFCPCEQSRDDFKQRYAKRFPDRAGQLSIAHKFKFYGAAELYYPRGVFSPWAMDEGLNRCFGEAQKDGPRNVRATAEMVWALRVIPGIEHLMAYESRLNYFIPGKPWISICLYNVNKFSGSTVMNVLKTHPYTISGGVITENPYYQDPDSWLASNAPQFLGHGGSVEVAHHV